MQNTSRVSVAQVYGLDSNSFSLQVCYCAQISGFFSKLQEHAVNQRINIPRVAAFGEC